MSSTTLTQVAERRPITELHATAFEQDGHQLVQPLRSTEAIMHAWASFNDLKLKLLSEDDFVVVNGQRYAKKSCFRKLALAFGISVEIVREDRTETARATTYLFTARAVSPNGRFMSSCASCSTDEKKFAKPSDARAIGQTRATNRAIADLIGWSAPSAEEVIGEGFEADSPHAFQDHAPNQDDTMTPKQRALLTSLICQRFPEPDEREMALSAIEGYSKQEASDAIKSMLEVQPA